VALSSCWRCARQTDVPTPAQIEASRALRGVALDPCPQGVLGFEFRRLLALPRGLDGLVVGLQPDRELAWGAFRRWTRRAGGARATSRSVKPNANGGAPYPRPAPTGQIAEYVEAGVGDCCHSSGPDAG
jgi:hypothetical protein